MSKGGQTAARPASSSSVRPNPSLETPRPRPGAPAGSLPRPAVAQPPTSATQPNAYAQAANYLTQAGTGAQAEMRYQPQQVAAANYQAALMAGVDPITAQTVTAGQIGSTDLGQYFNPYTQSVINTSLSDLDRQRQMTQQQNAAAAAAAGAFGGSRQGLVEAETNRGFADVAARTAAGLQQQGFLNAQQMAGQDIASRMQASLANQGANLTAAQQNAANQLMVQQANQAARNQAGQFGATQQMNAALANQSAGLAGSQQRLNAGAQLANIGSSGFNMANTLQQQQAQMGLIQQQMRQQQLNDAQQQFYGYANSPLAYLNTMNTALAGSPLQNASTTQYKPGALDYLSFGAGLMAL